MLSTVERLFRAGPTAAFRRFKTAVGLGHPGARYVIRRVPRVKPRRIIALSFDDGPAKHTPDLLDLLATHGARATFFLIGEHIDGREEIVRRTVAAGHELGNHLWSHPVAQELSDDDLSDEVLRTNTAIEAVSGAAPTLLRTPFFNDAERAIRLARELGLDRATHGIVGYDWKEREPERVASVLLRWIKPGEIVVLHDGVGRGSRGHDDRSVTVRAVELLLPELAARGYEIVTVSELLAAPP